MAYTTINKHTDYFNTKLYTGNDATSHSITGVGHQPDLVWLKRRNGTNDHQLQDSVRGKSGSNYYYIQSNNNNAQSVQGDNDGVNTLGTDGFTVGHTNSGAWNESGATYVAWNWKAGTTGSGYTSGSGTSKAYSYSVNTTAGFSIIKFQGNGTAGHTIPHHLGVAPDMVFLKNLDTTNNWYIWGSAKTGLDANQQVELNNNTAAYNPNGNYHNDTRPSSTVVTLGNDGGSNGNNNNIIIYAFASKTGYSKIGNYIGNGSTNGTFVYTGFAPSLVAYKNLTQTDEWFVKDNKRPGYNPTDLMFWSASNAEVTNLDRMDIFSNGFKATTTDKGANASGNKYLYIAIGQSLVGSNNVPCTAK